MASLVEKLDALSINDEKERKDLFGYIYRTKQSKNYFICENDFIVIPNCDNKKMVLCKLVRHESGNCFLCFACENSTVFENMNIEHYVKTKPLSCIHINLCKVIFAEISSKKASIPEHCNYVEVLNKEKVLIALVHPIQDKMGRLPGIVVLNSRTTKPKCDTCEGKKCVHVNIYNEGKRC